MGVGYPDYFGQSIFLSYGITKQEIVNQKTVNSDATDTSLQVNTKGKLTGGYIIVYDLLVTTQFLIQILVDTSSNAQMTNLSLWGDNLHELKKYPIICVNKDLVNGINVYQLTGDITFSNNISLWVTAYVNALKYHAQFLYTEVVI